MKVTPPKRQRKKFVQYRPTLTNEQIMALPVWPNKTKVGRDIVLTEQGAACVQKYSRFAWRKPFGETT